MIAAYVRVSSKKGQKTDSQVAEITRWLQANGYASDAVQWYEDKETGKTLNRPALVQLQADVFNGKVQAIVVWKIDRLSRRLIDGINLLASWCERGVKVIILTQQIELGGAVGRMIAALLLGLAEIELEYRRERQEAGIAVAKSKGRYQGRKAGTTKAKPARAIELREQGLTIAEICTALGVSKATALRYLKAA